jgi:hypothetical protein
MRAMFSDYPEELARIRNVQRDPNYRFTYGDYVTKILLATFIPRYFRVDMQQMGAGNGAGTATIAPAIMPAAATYSQPQNYQYPIYSSSTPQSSNDSCCVIL